MNRLRQLGKSLFLLVFIFPAFLFSDETDEHLPVGTRPMSAEAVSQIQNRKDEIKKEGGYTSTKEARSGFFFDRYPPVYYSSCVHWLAAVSAFGDSIECEDGSVWKINNYDSYKALNWRASDPLLITQNTRWFSSYAYRIINRNTGSSVETNLFLGPIKNGEHTRYIIAIDPTHGDIFLNDNTHWTISGYDYYIFRDWALNDAVIIGYNSGWDSSCESILINVNMNNFVRVKQF
jgi:hypothetical protein